MLRLYLYVLVYRTSSERDGVARGCGKATVSIAFNHQLRYFVILTNNIKTASRARTPDLSSFRIFPVFFYVPRLYFHNKRPFNNQPLFRPPHAVFWESTLVVQQPPPATPTAINTVYRVQ